MTIPLGGIIPTQGQGADFVAHLPIEGVDNTGPYESLALAQPNPGRQVHFPVRFVNLISLPVDHSHSGSTFVQAVAGSGPRLFPITLKIQKIVTTGIFVERSELFNVGTVSMSTITVTLNQGPVMIAPNWRLVLYEQTNNGPHVTTILASGQTASNHPSGMGSTITTPHAVIDPLGTINIYFNELRLEWGEASSNTWPPPLFGWPPAS